MNGTSDIGVPGVSDAHQIGAGAFGRVYRAHQDSLERTVAVKVLANVDLDEEAKNRFDREGKAVGKLSGHPNIVAVYEQGTTADQKPYLMMEYCPGGSYGDRVRAEGSLTWREATEAAIATAGALETAHRAGILHRDVKPDNILIDDYETPKLADFGIARVSKAANLTATGTLTGSPAHMPPELIAGKSASPASDVYSLASSLYAMIAGSPAFVRDSDESIVPMLQRISVAEPDRLEPHGVPSPIADVIARAMAKDPAARYPSCEAFGTALNEARRMVGVAPAPMKIHGRSRGDDGVGDLAPARYSSAGSAPSADSLRGATVAWGPPEPPPGQPGPMPPPVPPQQPPWPQQSWPPAPMPTGSVPAGSADRPAKSRKPLSITLSMVALVVIVGAVVALVVGREKPIAADHGSTGLLVDEGSVSGDWLPGNTVKMDLENTACGTIESPWDRIEEQAYIARDQTTPRWSTLGATAADATTAETAFTDWDAAFNSCDGDGAPDRLDPIVLTEPPCACEQSAAWHYGAEDGMQTRVGLVRRGDVVAGVMLQTTPTTENADELFSELMNEVGRRAEAVG